MTKLLLLNSKISIGFESEIPSFTCGLIKKSPPRLNLNSRPEKKISALLGALVIFDVTLSTVAFFWPQLWFFVFHGVEYVDPQGLLFRMAANWAAFALFQALAFIKWKSRPYWLVLVAGIRFSDIFTDWTYLGCSQNMTVFAKVGLFLMSPINFLIGYYLLLSYLVFSSRDAKNSKDVNCTAA